MKMFWTRYLPGYPKTLLYMLQNSDYSISDYRKWLARTSDFRNVAKRRRLIWTSKVKLLACAQGVILCMIVILAFAAGYVWLPLVIVVVLATPWLLAYGIIVPLFIGDVFVSKKRVKNMIADATAIIARHKAVKIAIAGSFGKTTAKEVLKTVLSEKYNVVATPGNMNTPVGISRFAKTLHGDEEIIIFEFGESHVGDVKELAELAQPDMGLITGINEAHLQTFGSIKNTVKTIFELQDYLTPEKVYKNNESRYVREHVKSDDPKCYGREGVGEWHVQKSTVTIDGTVLTLRHGTATVQVETKLLGRHNIGIIVAAAAIGESLGMTDDEIKNGIEKTKPFEHRMQPYKLNGAYIIDDTYNGNIEGIEAGLALLKSLEAKRRVYVTPGLVEQGSKTQEIHEKIGRLIALSADVVVLMNNSVTAYIQNGLKDAGFGGVVKVVDEPLEFYENLEHFVSTGDIVLMQNDWTDNYE